MNVFSTLPGGLAGPMSGSPQAASHVAGAIALYRAHHPGALAIDIAIDVPKLSSNRNILQGKCKSESILDLGVLIAEKRETIEAHIEAKRKVRVGEQVVFDGSRSEGPIVEYLWKFGDPLDEFGVTVPRRWQRPGRVGVELIVRTFDGRTASEAIEVTVEGNDELTRCGCSLRSRTPSGSDALLGLVAFALIAMFRFGYVFPVARRVR